MASPRDVAALARAGIACEAEGDRLRLSGRTFPLRETLRRCGGRWEPARASWTVDGSALSDVLVALETSLGLPEAQAVGFDLTGAASAPARGWLARWLRRSLPAAPTPMQPDVTPRGAGGRKHYHGHRKRLRHRAFEAGMESLPDYELLELLLSIRSRVIDTKPQAKALLERFGSLGGVLAAERGALAELTWAGGDGPQENLDFTATLLAAVRDVVRRVTKEPLRDRPLLDSMTALRSYLQVSLAHEPVEQVRALFLDARNGLIRDERQGSGTIDHVPLYPREIAKRALELGAAGVILVHNHPSGDPTPSRADLDTTRAVQAALQAVDVALHDHIVVGAQGQRSLRDDGAIR